MTSDLIRPPEKRYSYSNAFSGLADLVRTDGFHGLLRGLGTNTVIKVVIISLVPRLIVFSVQSSVNERRRALNFTQELL